jgi:hypothetical protein
MKTKHTPGPWRSVFRKDIGEFDILGEGEIPIATTYTICGKDNNHYDATLIAAAPDLLEVLQEIERRLVDPDNPRSQTWLCGDALHPNNDEKTIVDYIQAAIRKATE